MTPISFGSSARRLFGLFYAAESSPPQRSAVLVCPPFGHEAVRSHRLLRVLTERLCRDGHDVLRFDYFGTGDSLGDDEDGDTVGWSVDVRTAHAELKRRSPGAHVTWLGARFGATLGVLASQAPAVDVRRLLLWDPIVDGPHYVKVLREKHVEAMEQRYFVPDPAWRKQLATDALAFSQEAIGFAISARLREQLLAIGPSNLTLSPAVAVRILAPSNDTAVNAWATGRAAAGGNIARVVLDHQLVWTSDPEPYSAMVPPEVVRSLLQQFHE